MATTSVIEGTIVKKIYPFLQIGQDVTVSINAVGIHIAISGKQNPPAEILNILQIIRDEVAPGTPVTVETEGGYSGSIP